MSFIAALNRFQIYDFIRFVDLSTNKYSSVFQPFFINLAVDGTYSITVKEIINQKNVLSIPIPKIDEELDIFTHEDAWKEFIARYKDTLNLKNNRVNKVRTYDLSKKNL